MKALFRLLFIVIPLTFGYAQNHKVFDIHLHGSPDILNQIKILENAGVTEAAISTSWDLQNSYSNKTKIKLHYGLMVPCPNGKVPYSNQQCFTNGSEWPDIKWVESEIKNGKIDFIGEVLAQYHGISPSDSLLLPYYALAEKYNIPVGIHTGSAGPNHGCPNFKEEMGNPLLLKEILLKYPKLKIWIMHAGGPPFIKETILLMKEFPSVYADISVINNPDIIPKEYFTQIMQELISSGLVDRLLFGSDNFPIDTTLNSVKNLTFLSNKQKEKILYNNAKKLFQK